MYEKRGRLDLTPHKAGQFIIRADLLNSGDAWGASVRATNAMDKPGSAKNIDIWKEAINPIYSQTFYLTVLNPRTNVPENPPTTVQQLPAVNKQPINQVTNTPPVEKVVAGESNQPEVNTQNNQEQNIDNDTSSPADDSNQKKARFFSPVSSFFKNIFRSIGIFFTNMSK